MISGGKRNEIKLNVEPFLLGISAWVPNAFVALWWDNSCFVSGPISENIFSAVQENLQIRSGIS